MPFHDLVPALLIASALAQAQAPDSVVWEAGKALAARDSARFSRLVDVSRLAQSLGQGASELEFMFSDSASRSTNRTVSPRSAKANASNVVSALHFYFNGAWTRPRLDAFAADAFFVRPDSFHVGTPQVSANKAIVPLSVFEAGESKVQTVSLELERIVNSWRIVAIPGFAAVFAGERRRAYVAISGMKDDLLNMIIVQEEYFWAHQGKQYTSSLPDLRAADANFRLHEGVSIVIDSAATGGWRAHATHPAVPGLLCSIQVGFRKTDEGDVVCR
jgi:hypothetical protein